MFTGIIEFLGGIVISIISALGYFGVFACMAVESACIPLPSEIIMPFSGFLVSTGKFDLISVTLWGAFGNLTGSLIAYFVGYYGGRPFALKYGKYFLVSKKDIDEADIWFGRYGEQAVFFARMMPIIRTFISLPAGISRMKIIPFSVYSFVGSVPWCLMLVYVGFKLGQNWHSLGGYFHKADIFVGIFLAAGLLWWIKKHFSRGSYDRIY